MKLTAENYYSPEANLHYVDYSTTKDFCGTCGRKGCECRALATARGEYIRPKSKALLVGGYVDAYFDGSLDAFKAENPDCFKRDGELKADFIQANIMIERAMREPLFRRYTEGETQVILTAEIAGVPVRVKLDSYDGNRITDIKTAASMTQTYYAADLGERLSFVDYFDYVSQAFFYTEAVRQNFNKDLPFYLAVITKEKEENTPHPRVGIIHIPSSKIEEKRREVEINVQKVWALLHEDIAPIPCGTCAWCADNLPLERVISMDELLLSV